MNTRTLRLSLVGALSVLAVVYAPLHYSWRWARNERLFQQERIINDDWAADQFFIPAESWSLGVCGGATALFVIWRLTRFGIFSGSRKKGNRE